MPQLKQHITSIEQMTCEHCIYSSWNGKHAICNNASSNLIFLDTLDDGNGPGVCSFGEWLYFGKWFSDEAKEQLHTMSYSELYLRFAELAS